METHQEVTLLIGKIAKDWNRTITGEDFSRIDKDILIADIRKLYDLVHELKTNTSSIHSVPDNVEEKELTTSESIDPEIQETEPRPREKAATEKIDEEQKTAKNQDPKDVDLEIISAEAEPEEELDSKKPAEIHHEEPKQTVEEPKNESGLSASEKFPAAKTLADMYSSNGDKSLAARMQKNRISDLKSAIGINERFLFINEIFKGETTRYKKAIEKLNGMTHYLEAIEFLEEIKTENNVENKDACTTLVEILKRRFA